MSRPALAAVLLAALCLGAACVTRPDPEPHRDGGGGVSDGGGPTPIACDDPGYARCDGECVNLGADARHCGACGTACKENGSCQHGACACPKGTVDCGDVCADLKVNADHCGQCGRACAPGSACLNGACVEQCAGGAYKCGGSCVDPLTDASNCGSCGVACTHGKACVEGVCRCADGEGVCGGECTDTATDTMNCGGCGQQCFGTYVCTGGQCACPAGRTNCQTLCADTQTDRYNCGGCSITCQASQSCINGHCDTPCPAGYTRCNGSCVDTQTDALHCGACGNACGNLSCQNGTCAPCNSATTDCDHDGWMAVDGDCCDQPGACGSVPALVNPGALELVGDGLDNNCNGLVDAADVLDTRSCDASLASNSANADDFARALGICRTTPAAATGAQKTWGLISAQLVLADGTPISNHVGHSIRDTFGSVLKPQEGRSFVVLSSGAAADEAQTNPGPNGGPTGTSISQNTSVDIQSCTAADCIKDWFAASNPPLKQSNLLPEAPGCSGGTLGINFANDSVMLELTLRAPTNVKAFQFKGYFLSSEYAEYVCTLFNDQFVALVDTPGGAPLGALNPPDKNLMTYAYNGQQWPIGINVAHGTGIFKVCQDQTANPTCWDTDVSAQSCSNGIADLAGTGFEAWAPGSCTNGGGTGWLTTRGNIRPGEIVTLRIALWDAGDHILDSLALLDAFQWLQSTATPGTTD